MLARIAGWSAWQNWTCQLCTSLGLRMLLLMCYHVSVSMSRNRMMSALVSIALLSWVLHVLYVLGCTWLLGM